jgi:DNA replication protein DnaC
VADRHADLRTMLRTLKLPAMSAAFPDLALKAAKAGQTHEAFLYDLVQGECVQRDERRIARLLHRSGLPQEKTFAALDLARFPLAVRLQIERLQNGAFVEEAINVIAVGRPGTGKSHLAAALGHALVVRGQPVRWTTTAQLVQQLLAAKRDLRLPQVLAQLDRFACLILDDIGYVQHDRDAQRGAHDQPGLLGVDAHLQGPDDDPGGDRPGRASRGHHRLDGGGQLSREGGQHAAGPAAGGDGDGGAGEPATLIVVGGHSS